MTDPDVRVVGQHNHLPEDTIAMMFARFEQAVLGHWNHQWRQEARKIFYAGFQSCMRAVAGGGAMTEEAWQAYFQRLHDEMGRHVESVVAEAAAQPGEDPT